MKKMKKLTKTTNNQTLTRVDIIEKIVKTTKFSPQKSKEFFEAAIELMITSLIEEEGLKITSFGSFRVIQKPKRLGRNPKTGTEAIITPRKSLAFRPSHHLKAKVEKQGGDQR